MTSQSKGIFIFEKNIFNYRVNKWKWNYFLTHNKKKRHRKENFFVVLKEKFKFKVWKIVECRFHYIGSESSIKS